MSDKKHIDRLFQEKLKDFEVTPNDAVWDNIHDRLHKDKRKRRIIPIWWQVASVAALLALLITIGSQFMSDSTGVIPNNTIVDTEKKSSDSSVDGKSLSTSKKDANDSKNNSSEVASENIPNDPENTNEDNNEASNINSNNNEKIQNYLNSSSENKNSVVTNAKRDASKKHVSNNLADHDNKTSQKDAISTNKNSVVNISEVDETLGKTSDAQNNKEQLEIGKLIKESKNNTNSAITELNKKDDLEVDAEIKELSIEDAIAEANTEDTKDEKETRRNRWNISPNVAPVYFNSLGKGSSLDDQFVDNTKNSEVTISYGVGGSYAINDKIKVRAGINKVNMGYSTENVIAFRSIDPSSALRGQMKNVSVNSSGENMTYMSAESLDSNSTPEIINSKSSGSINQRFGFIEVPLEMEYALVNNKFGLNVIGGFSTLIVDENEIYSVLDGRELRIGEANNINNMSYSANFGFGINYNISDKIKVNVEPTFKYQINTFSDSSGDFQPFFIGIYTGLSYKF